jgi:hypothetical protein
MDDPTSRSIVVLGRSVSQIKTQETKSEAESEADSKRRYSANLLSAMICIASTINEKPKLTQPALPGLRIASEENQTNFPDED